MPSSGLILMLGVVTVAAAMPTCRLRGYLVEKVHNALNDMVELFPVTCVDIPIGLPIAAFPSSAFPPKDSTPTQCPLVLWTTYYTLQEVEKLFEKLPHGVCNQQKLDRFRTYLYRIVEEGSCLKTQGGSVLSSFFSNVTAAIEDAGNSPSPMSPSQNSSVCVWGLFRTEVLNALNQALLDQRACFN